jgi:DNA-binding transcriptional regulator PaaX
LRQEREAWLDALWHDPLLPSALLPGHYAGLRAWEVRAKAMREAGERIRAFKVAMTATLNDATASFNVAEFLLKEESAAAALYR